VFCELPWDVEVQETHQIGSVTAITNGRLRFSLRICWIALILSAIALVFAILLKETYAPTILQKKAARPDDYISLDMDSLCREKNNG
jgi:hypothetical protein